MKRLVIIPIVLLTLQTGLNAQQVLSLEECRQMALESNSELEQARIMTRMAGYDRKIARANYFPDISVSGTYMYNSRDIALVGDETSARLAGMGTAVQEQISGQMQAMVQAVMSNPAAAAEFMGSPMWQTVMGSLSKTDVSAALNALGAEIDKAFHLDMTNVFAGVVSLKQPVFAGGKIVASNRIAALAEQLSMSQYDSKCQETLLAVDQAYWQVVSVASKKKLAESYADLLHCMVADADASVAEGVATEADALTVKVKANEADMLFTKASNGLVLSKMLLCKQIGLPLESDVMLADENAEMLPQVSVSPVKDMEDIFADRPEIRSLDIAAQIYEQKVNVARADMLPKIAVTANYMVSNPNLYNGFQNKWGGMFNAGVAVNIPVFHGTEALQKTRKAKEEARLYRVRYDDAREMVSIQVEQLRRQRCEITEKLRMAQSNLENAEENLRVATIGFEEGIVPANTALAAQSAWLSAHSEFIDAGVELQMNMTALLKAEGEYGK